MIIDVTAKSIDISESFHQIQLEAQQAFHEYRMNALLERYEYLKEEGQELAIPKKQGKLKVIIDKFIAALKKAANVVISKIKEVIKSVGTDVATKYCNAGIDKCMELLKKSIDKQHGLLGDTGNMDPEDLKAREDNAKAEFDKAIENIRKVYYSTVYNVNASRKIKNPNSKDIQDGKWGGVAKHFEDTINAKYNNKNPEPEKA